MTKSVFLTTAVLLLAACGAKSEADNNNAAEANTAAPVADANTASATPAAAPSDGSLSADYMVGKWSAMDEDCKDTIEFRKDGTVVTPIGEGKWTLVGDQLTFDYGDGSKQPASAIKVLSPERIEITRGSGGKETEKRC